MPIFASKNTAVDSLILPVIILFFIPPEWKPLGNVSFTN